MLRKSYRKRNGEQHDTRYFCSLCGRSVNHWPLYVHELVWHTTDPLQAPADSASEDFGCDCRPEADEFCWKCQEWNWPLADS